MKQTYTIILVLTFFIININASHDNPPAYVEEMFSDKAIQDYGYFDNIKVGKLKEKFKSGNNISEVDNMALAGILSTQLIHLMFIAKTSKPNEEDMLSNLKIIRE